MKPGRRQRIPICSVVLYGQRKSAGDKPRRYVLLPVLALLFPGNAFAAEVGCFCTALFLGTMFLVGLGITFVMKYLLARYLWRVPRTPWPRIVALTWLELVLIILVFALIHTNFLLTLLIYLPFAMLVNMKLLAKVSQTALHPAPLPKKYAVFLLLSLALPASIQIAGVLGTAITNMITFADLRM